MANDVKGIILIHNLHLGLQRPALRFDEDYWMTVTSKLEKVLEIARSRSLLPVFSGSLCQKVWDTSSFTFLAQKLRGFDTIKPIIVLDEPMMMRTGIVRSNSVPAVLQALDVCQIVQNGDTIETTVGDDTFLVSMGDAGRMILQKGVDNPKTLIHNDTSLPSLVRVQLSEREAPSAVIVIEGETVEDLVLCSEPAPIDDVQFDVAEEIKEFDSELVDRLQRLLNEGEDSVVRRGDDDLKKLCEEENVSMEARSIIFQLKDEVNAEDIT